MTRVVEQAKSPAGWIVAEVCLHLEARVSCAVKQEREFVRRQRQAHAARFDIRLLQRPQMQASRELFFIAQRMELRKFLPRKHSLRHFGDGCGTRVRFNIDAHFGAENVFAAGTCATPCAER